MNIDYYYINTYNDSYDTLTLQTVGINGILVVSKMLIKSECLA